MCVCVCVCVALSAGAVEYAFCIFAVISSQ